MEAGRQRVEAAAIRRVQPWADVLLAGLECDLTGKEKLTAAEDGHPRGEPLGVGAMVAAPGNVQAPDLAGPEAEPTRARRHDEGRVGAGPAAPVVAHQGAGAERPPLRHALAAVPAGQVQQLGRLGGNRKGEHQAVELVPGRRMLIANRCPQPEQSGGRELDLDGQRERSR
jgi:hypothetical protein